MKKLRTMTLVHRKVLPEDLFLKHWPLPNIHPRRLPEPGGRGSFWEDRGDRRHAGIDLYAPAGSPVAAIEDGTVLDVTVFTSPEVLPYWNTTYSILIRNHDGTVLRYAELGEVFVRPGQAVCAGDVIAAVGLVLAVDRIDDASPDYIRRLKTARVDSMLHLERYAGVPEPDPNYLGGNFFRNEPPANLLDPYEYLLEVSHTPVSLRF